MQKIARDVAKVETLKYGHRKDRTKGPHVRDIEVGILWNLVSFRPS